MKVIYNTLLFLWQLPQNLVALLLIWIYNSRKVTINKGLANERVINNRLRILHYNGQEVYVYERFPGGVSLGKYILLDFYFEGFDYSISKNRLSTNIKHEYGHCRQSGVLGVFYLLVIGIFSGIHNILHQWGWAKGNYYKYWCEKWADKLGGVER